MASAETKTRSDGGTRSPEQRQQPQREGDVGGHRHAQPPTVGAPALSAKKTAAGTAMPPRAAAIGRAARDRIGEFARHHFALDLDPDDQEEDRHQAVVHPLLDAQAEAGVVPADGHDRLA